MKRKKQPLRIDIRDIRIPGGGRFSCSARTSSAPEFRKREAAVRSLIDAGAFDILKRIVKGPNRLHLNDVVAAVQRGDIESLRLAKGNPLLLGATVDRLRQRKKATRSAGTQLQVNVTTKQLEEFCGVVRSEAGEILQDVDLTTIETRTCEAFLHGPKEGGRPWAPPTQGVKHAYAKQVWDIAIAEEAESAERENRKPRLRRNPWRFIEPAPIHQTRVIYLTAPERDAMLRKLEGTRLCAFMAVAYHAGLRVGEAVMLRTDIDVDLANGMLHIQSRPGEHEWKTKNRKDRDVPINRDLHRILERHVELGFAGQRYFFRTTKEDRPLGTGTSWAWWVEAYEAAGIKHGRADADAVVYHTGRHSFASLLVQQGISPMIVAELLGDELKQVVDVYGHLAPHNLADAVKLLESTPVSTESSTGKKPGAA